MITPRVGDSNPLLGFIPVWIRHLAQKVDHLWVITPRAEAVPLPENVQVFEVGRDYARGETIFQAIWKFYRVLWRLIRSGQVDGIFAHLYPKFTIMAGPLARVLRVPLVMWFTHTHVSGQLRLAHLFANRVVTASKGSYNIQNDKVRVVGHGIDTHRFRPQSFDLPRQKSSWTLLSVGRVVPSKHYEVMIAAIEKLTAQKEIAAQLIVVGDVPPGASPDYLQALRDDVERRGLAAKIHFVGSKPHESLVEIYQTADIFVSASETGLDKAVLEAMACGVIPLASLAEFRPTLGRYADLLMYPPGDGAGLASSIARLAGLSAAELSAIAGAMPAQVENQHSAAQLMEKIRAIFADLRGENGAKD